MRGARHARLFPQISRRAAATRSSPDRSRPARHLSMRPGETISGPRRGAAGRSTRAHHRRTARCRHSGGTEFARVGHGDFVVPVRCPRPRLQRFQESRIRARRGAIEEMRPYSWSVWAPSPSMPRPSEGRYAEGRREVAVRATPDLVGADEVEPELRRRWPVRASNNLPVPSELLVRGAVHAARRS